METKTGQEVVSLQKHWSGRILVAVLCVREAGRGRNIGHPHQKHIKNIL